MPHSVNCQKVSKQTQRRLPCICFDCVTTSFLGHFHCSACTAMYHERLWQLVVVCSVLLVSGEWRKLILRGISMLVTLRLSFSFLIQYQNHVE